MIAPYKPTEPESDAERWRSHARELRERERKIARKELWVGDATEAARVRGKLLKEAAFAEGGARRIERIRAERPEGRP